LTYLTDLAVRESKCIPECRPAGAINLWFVVIPLFFSSNYFLPDFFNLRLCFCFPFSLSFSVSSWLLILTFCFHFTIHVIADAFVLSVPILFHNAALQFVCRFVSHVLASSSLPHLNCDVLNQWLPRHSHGIHRFANDLCITMHKDRIGDSKELNEIEMARSVGEKLTISTLKDMTSQSWLILIF
jgi:hypothetical protein